MKRRRGRPVRTHPYTAAATVPADRNGNRPCICGRAEPNQVHDRTAVAKVDAAQAEHLRRVGDEL